MRRRFSRKRNCHKWLCAPKGAGFLHARPEHHDRLDPAIVSWGSEPGTSFSDRIELQGTRDCAAWLAVPDAIHYQRERSWDDVRARARALALEARDALCEALGTEPLAASELLAQMASVRLPASDPELGHRLFGEHRVEVLVGGAGRDLLRVSVAAYTTRAEVDRLLSALAR